ncbi:hypothetical protein LINPERPRIM_LOCUS20733, partial [Linum perenne]
RYARVCVEIDRLKPFLGKYIIEDRVFHVEYESIENMCFSCGFYGQKDAAYPSHTSESTREPVADTMQETKKVREGDFRKWMTVCRRKNTRKPLSKTPTGKSPALGTRFDILSRNSDPPTVLENNSMPKATGITTKTGSTTAPIPHDSQVEALKRVLDAALANGYISAKETSRSTKLQQKKPFKNITNTGVGTKSKKGDGKL